jgi:ApaG protein
MPAASRGSEYGFFLKVEVQNLTDSSLRLLSRRWQYCDAHHHQTDLNGPCMGGQQPEILPGATYTFPATIKLLTPWGSLKGCLRFLDGRGALFEAPFSRVILAPQKAEAIEASQI